MNSKTKAILRRHFNENEYALLFEVRDNAGFEAKRSLDAMAFNLWPSRGLEIHGIEIKSSRTDWLRELRDPGKQESMLKYCDRFWLLALDESIAAPSEIPPTWGHMVIKSGKITRRKEAPFLKPEPLSRGVVAAMLKRATHEMIHRSNIQSEIDAAIRIAHSNYEGRIKSLESQIEFNRKALEEFEEKSGLSIDRWDIGNIAEAVKLVRNGQADYVRQELQGLRQTLSRLTAAVDAIISQPEKDEILCQTKT